MPENNKVFLNISMLAFALTLPGYASVQNSGIVRGITFRSRCMVGNFFGPC